MGHQFASGQEVKESAHLRLVYHWCKYIEKQVGNMEKWFFYTYSIAVGLISLRSLLILSDSPIQSWLIVKILQNS